jgi:CubicO group peptidase (beta-lactamase class C family)
MKVLAVLMVALGIQAMPEVAFASPLTAAQVASVDKIVKSAMAKEHLSGVEIGIGRNGRVLFDRGYGLRDRSRHLPVTATTVFAVGSISKSFTATGVMLLVQEGRVALDARVARYLPSVPHAREVTVRELLNQTSGVPDYLDNTALFHSIVNSTVKTRTAAQYVQMTAGKPLLFKPGSKWAYSNTNYAILGMIIQKVTGEPYARFLAQRIFRPLKLSATQIMDSLPPQGANVAEPYTYAKGRYARVPRQSMSWANAAGSVASDASDLIAFDGAFFAGKVVTPASMHTMVRPPPNRPMTPSKDRVNNLAIGYGFAWARGADEGRRVEWHNGGLIGGRAMNAVWPHDGLEVVVLTNVTDAEPEAAAMRIARLLYK